jgi:hypothetical protein
VWVKGLWLEIEKLEIREMREYLAAAVVTDIRHDNATRHYDRDALDVRGITIQTLWRCASIWLPQL